MAEEEKPAAEGSKKGKGFLFIIIGVVVVILILVAVVVFLFMGGDEEEGSSGGGDSSVSASLSPEQRDLIQNEVYRNPVAIQPLEKDFLVNLKSPNPDNPREGGFVKFSATFLFADKNSVKEVDAKQDVIRAVILDATSNFMGAELQSPQGKKKLRDSITENVNKVLTDGKVAATVFSDFIIQP